MNFGLQLDLVVLLAANSISHEVVAHHANMKTI